MSESDPVNERAAIRAALDAVSIETMRRSAKIKWRRWGDAVIPAWVADMDFPVAPPIHRRLCELVERHDFGYHHLPLPDRLRQALVERMAQRYSWQIEPRQVFALVTVVQGLDAAIQLYTQPGDGVVLLTPIYAPFHVAVDRGGRRRVDSPLVLREAGDPSSRFEIDFDHLRSSLDARTRLLLLCNPHNPTGRVFERPELETLAGLALEHDLIVISDEIHADLVYQPQRHVPFATLGPEVAARTVTLTSATKAFNLAGLPYGLAIFGSQELKRPFREMPPHLLGHGGLLGSEAVISAWTEGDAWLDVVLDYLQENRQRVGAVLAERLPRAVHRTPEATYLSWLDLRAYELQPDPWTFLFERAGVATSPGPDFGPPGEGFVRLNFATSREVLDEILSRIAEAVNAAG